MAATRGHPIWNRRLRRWWRLRSKNLGARREFSHYIFPAWGRLDCTDDGAPKRYYGAQQLHFIHCSCYHRQPWLARPERRDLFLKVLEQVRRRYGFVVVGYVVMPDHIHLLTVSRRRLARVA